MKIKLSELYFARETLKKLFSEAVSVKLAYRLSRISKKVNAEMKLVEEQRNELVKKYADEQSEEDKKKNVPISVSPSKFDEFRKEFDELLDEEIDIDTYPVELDLLSEFKLSANDMSAIEKFVTETKKE